MRIHVLAARLGWLTRIAVLLGVVLLVLGLSLEWLSFDWVTLLFLLALLLPFCWPRQAGSWPGLLLLLVLSWLPVLVVRVATLSMAATSLLLLVLLTSMIAAPGALVLLMRQRSASVAVMLLGFALFPCQFTVLLARTGAPPLDASSTGDALLSNLAWLPGIWYPVLAMCLGAAGFIISLSILVVQELRRTTQA